VIVDTNALLIPGEFGVDIFHELERLGYSHIIVPKAVLNELEVLMQKSGLKGKEKIAAKVGYSLVLKYASGGGRYNVTIEGEEDDEGTDKLIAKLAAKLEAAVFTLDEDLKRELTHAGIQTVYLRGKSRLEVSE
jgi:rRNA-processing protein FCF1